MVGLGVLALVAMGSGCTLPPLPNLLFLAKDMAATEVSLVTDATLVLEQTNLNPLEKFNRQPERTVKLTDWVAHERVKFTWNETTQRETAASIAARDAAEHATPVGQASNIPEAVYETITQQGTLTANALGDGSRILLPSAWPETDTDLTDKSNTIIWLSQAQYEELSTTRHTHIAIGSVDAGLQTAANALEAVKTFIQKLAGSGEVTVSDQDITEIEASADWGEYVFTWNEDKVSVQTIEAENQFAHYTILANPDNPLILAIDLKPWAYGTEALGVISDDLKISGYRITKISLPK